jgi:hypothetical protein
MDGNTRKSGTHVDTGWRDPASERTGVAAQRSGMPPGSNGEMSRPLGSRTGQASRRRGH